MANYALVRDGVVGNIIVADDEDWLAEYIKDYGYEAFVDTSTFADQVAIGYVKKGSQYLPAATLTSNKSSITTNGNDSATITYTDNRPNPPSSCDGTVNGQPLTIQLVNGVGTFDVTSANSGDTVTIAFPDAEISIGVS